MYYLHGLSRPVLSAAQVDELIIEALLVSNSCFTGRPILGVANIQTKWFWTLKGFVLLSTVNAQWWSSCLIKCLSEQSINSEQNIN